MTDTQISKKTFALRLFIVIGIPAVLAAVFYLSMQYSGEFDKIAGEGTKFFKDFRGAKIFLCLAVFLVTVIIAALILAAIIHTKNKEFGYERINERSYSGLPDNQVSLNELVIPIPSSSSQCDGNCSAGCRNKAYNDMSNCDSIK